MEIFYSGTCTVIFIKDLNTAYVSVRHNAAAPQNNVTSESSSATKNALFGPKNACSFQILDLTLQHERYFSRDFNVTSYHHSLSIAQLNELF